MIFYVKIDEKSGKLSSASKENFNDALAVKVSDEYSNYFIDYLDDFTFIEGEPVSTAFPKNSLQFDTKIMQAKLKQLDVDGDTADVKITKLQQTLGFSIQQTSDVANDVANSNKDLANSNKDLVKQSKELQEQVGLLAKQVADLKQAADLKGVK